MIKKLLCLYEYIAQTQTGDRNTNLFKALTHLRKYNQSVSKDDFIKEALSINKEFESPLNETEVVTICKHALSKNYHSTCWKFKTYCRHCKYGEFRKTFRQSKPKYWKHINENNRIVGIKTIPDDEYYPWDILDTSKLTPEDAAKVQMFREEMGIPIVIDSIVKSYGIPIGDKAKREWEKFKKSD